MKIDYTCQSVKDRIIIFLESVGDTVTGAEKKCGFSKGSIRKTKFNLSPDRLEVFLKTYPQLSRVWLMSGEGTMLFQEEENPPQRRRKSSSPPPDIPDAPEKPPKDYISLLPSVAHGGRLTDFSPSIVRHECETVVSPVAHADFAMQVLGDSMEPQLPNGCRIFIKRIDEALFLEWGKVYVIDTPNGVVVKKVMPTETEGIVECISLNPVYPPFKIDMSKVFGVYRVLAIVTMY